VRCDQLPREPCRDCRSGEPLFSRIVTRGAAVDLPHAARCATARGGAHEGAAAARAQGLRGCLHHRPPLVPPALARQRLVGPPPAAHPPAPWAQALHSASVAKQRSGSPRAVRAVRAQRRSIRAVFLFPSAPAIAIAPPPRPDTDLRPFEAVIRPTWSSIRRNGRGTSTPPRARAAAPTRAPPLSPPPAKSSARVPRRPRQKAPPAPVTRRAGTLSSMTPRPPWRPPARHETRVSSCTPQHPARSAAGIAGGAPWGPGAVYRARSPRGKRP
jgi:hypothetical protein